MSTAEAIAGAEGLEGLKQWGRERQLGELDALMWRTDRFPAGAWSGIVMMLLDSEPDWEALRAGVRWLIDLVPRFGERVVEPMLPVGPPFWDPDPHFDLDYHLRRVRLEAPGSMRDLLDFAQQVALTPMDRTRPPWSGYLVCGLEGDRAALVCQAHHVLMDGMATTQLLMRVLSPQRDSSTEIAVSSPDSPLARISPLGATTRSVARQARGAPRALRRIGDVANSTLRHPRDAAQYAASLVRVLAPPPPMRSQTLHHGARRSWCFGTFECEFSELRAAGKAAGGTLNDTFVSALLGGLRHYCAAHGEDLGDLPISMPVSMRKMHEAMGGNKFAGAFFPVPSGIADPAQRIAEMHRRTDRVRSEPALDFIGNLTPILNRTPSALAAGLLGSINQRAALTTSSWPGITEERYLAGAKFERMFVLAPLPGTIFTGAMLTHCGTCCIAVNADGDVIEDPPLLWECIQRGLDEVLALGA